MSFTPIGDALNAKMRQNTPLKKQLDAGEAVYVAETVFRDMFGEGESLSVKPLFLKNRTLTVTCTSSVIAQEIRLNQTLIVGKINEKLGRIEVDRIRYLA